MADSEQQSAEQTKTKQKSSKYWSYFWDDLKEGGTFSLIGCWATIIVEGAIYCSPSVLKAAYQVHRTKQTMGLLSAQTLVGSAAGDYGIMYQDLRIDNVSQS